MRLRWTALISTLLAAIVAGAMVCIAFQGNKQGGFVDYETRQVDWIHAFELFTLWFVSTLLMSFGLILAGRTLASCQKVVFMRNSRSSR